MIPTRVHKPIPLRGRRTSLPADIIGDDFSPENLNVRFRFGEVRPTPGRDVLSGPQVNEPVLWLGQFPQLDGTVWAVMLTKTRLFRWGDSIPGTPRQWHEVQPGSGPPTGSTRWSVAFGEAKMFFGRIDDPIYYWDGNSAHSFFSIESTAGLQGITGGSTVPKARYLEYFNDRLILANVLENGQSIGNRIRWTESGNFLHWDETKQLGAGFLDAVEGGQEPINAIKSFGSGQRMFFATRRAVKDLVATGTLDPVHLEQLRVRGMGCVGPYTVGTTGQQVFFLGYDRDIYAWDGVTLVAIGEPIQEELHAVTSPDQVTNYFAAVSINRQEYWFVLPTGDAFIFDYQRQAWSRDTVPGFTALGEVEDTTTAPTWLTISTFWNTETHTWEELEGVLSTILFGGRPDGSTAIVDDTISYDYFSIGSIIDRFLETPDFYIDETAGMTESTVLRFMLIYQYVVASPFVVGVSFDRGITWHEQQVTPQMDGFSLVEFDGPHTGNTVRFRFRENDATGQFRWRSYSWEWIASGDYIGTTTG